MKAYQFSLVVPLVLAWFVVLDALALDGWRHELRATALAQGPPSLPARFYGAVTLDGQAVVTGTLISAVINGTTYATAATVLQNATAIYVIDVPGDNPGTPEIDGGRDGDVIHFTVGNLRTVQNAPWQFGQTTELDLSAASVTPVTVTPTAETPATMTPVTPMPLTPAAPMTIPEPVTVVLFGIGLVGLGSLLTRRQRRRRKPICPPV